MVTFRVLSYFLWKGSLISISLIKYFPDLLKKVVVMALPSTVSDPELVEGSAVATPK